MAPGITLSLSEEEVDRFFSKDLNCPPEVERVACSVACRTPDLGAYVISKRHLRVRQLNVVSFFSLFFLPLFIRRARYRLASGIAVTGGD